MAFVSEKTQQAVLRRTGISIETVFWQNRALKIRTTDHSQDDDVKNGIILEKRYYRNSGLLDTEKEFSPMLMYTYIGSGELKKEVTCPNCGRTGLLEEFADGCPYCGTNYNITYTDRQEGAQFLASRNKKNPWLYAAALVISLAVCLAVSFLIVRTTGRTFMLFDKLKAVFFGVVPGLVLFYGFYVLNAFVISRRAEENYEKQTRLIQAFEKELLGMQIPMSTFYNCLHSELSRIFFAGNGGPDKGKAAGDEEETVIDFDILECTDYQIEKKPDGHKEIHLNVLLRKELLDSGRLHARKEKRPVTLLENKEIPDELHPGVNIIQCRNCGASVDVTKDSCPYCGTRINYRQRLYLK